MTAELTAKKSLHLRAIMILSSMLMELDESVSKDENIMPEIRDINRLSILQKPRTNAGKDAYEQAKHQFTS
jgi:hypothetical protein